MALLIAYRTWTEIKTRVYFAKNVFFWESGYLTYIYCQKNWVCWKDMDKFVSILKIAARHDFVYEFNSS